MIRRLYVLVLLLLACAVAACSSDHPPAYNGVWDSQFGMDAVDDFVPLDIVPIDIAPRDAGDPLDALADVPTGMHCVVDTDCAFGAVCLQGLCARDACRTSENTCGPSSRCQMRCVPTRDLCAGVRCAGDETCFLGRCVPGCFPAPCAGINCPAGQFCDDSLGACAPIQHCSGRCETDYACHIGCLPRSPCDGVTCPSTQVCANGTCVDNPCSGVRCAATALCVEGHCVDTCHCDPACNRSPRDHCVVGTCVCDRTCTAGGACGADDGCGGHCIGTCPQAGAVCDPASYTCICTPLCLETTPCGGSDGCGGICDGGCMPGQRCNTATRTCECITHCPSAMEYANYDCGMNIPNACPGMPSCGSGTHCPMGLMCMGGRCTNSMDDAGMPEGGMCGSGTMMCGGSCVDTQTSSSHCGNCDTVCPVGTTCVAGACTCPGGQTLCGGFCVNTQADQANCGSCGNACSAIQMCNAGVCSCVPRCSTDPVLVACGMPVPNDCAGGPSCGTGRLCTAGELCDPTTHTCMCVPRCPVGVACGVSDGCGGQCIGTCATGQTCTRDPMDATRYFCSSAGCVGGCACNQVCSNNHCVTVTCAGGGSPCPCSCCPLGQRCVGGSTCEPIPP